SDLVPELQGLPQRSARDDRGGDRARDEGRSLVRLAPLLHGEGRVRRRGGPRGEVPEEVRRQLLQGQEEVSPPVGRTQQRERPRTRSSGFFMRPPGRPSLTSFSGSAVLHPFI